MRRSREPFIWAFFSSGGMIAAFTLPAIVALLWIAPAIGWVEPLSYDAAAGRFRPLLVRLFLLVLVSLSLYHWGHRFRYTLYDGLQLKHLFGLIATICYGGATALTLWAAWVLLLS